MIKGGCERLEHYERLDKYHIHEKLLEFVNKNVLEPHEINDFWEGVESLLERFIPVNQTLLEQRKTFERLLQEWYSRQDEVNPIEYETFLTSIGYIEPVVEDFNIDVLNVDREIAHQAGPQLVVPLDNARYALNAANARWGSLYDALYGTDMIDETDGMEKGRAYNPVRGNEVIRLAKQFLDDTFPLPSGSHKEVTRYVVRDDVAYAVIGDDEHSFADDSFVGYTGEPNELKTLMLQHNALHVELQFDREHPIGKIDPAGLMDIELESALSWIVRTRSQPFVRKTKFICIVIGSV